MLKDISFLEMHIEDRASSVEEALWRSYNRGYTDGSSTAPSWRCISGNSDVSKSRDARPDLSQPMTALHASSGYYCDVYSENSCEVRAESRAVCIIYIISLSITGLLSLFICFSLVDIYKQRVDIFLKPFSASHNKIHNGCSLIML